MLRRTISHVAACLLLAPGLSAQPTFRVTVRPEAAQGETSFSGRLVVYLLREPNTLRSSPTPASGPFFVDPQPMVGLDVAGVGVLEEILVTDGTVDAFFPGPLSVLPAGRYTAQAVLDRARLNSRWDREPGNLYSEPVSFTLLEGETTNIDLRLDARVQAPPVRPAPGVEIVRASSPTLSRFRDRPTTLNATVIYPIDYDDDRSYPAVYEIPGFGGDHLSGLRRAGRVLSRSLTPAEDELHRSAFWIVLDPEGPNGHHLFLNSPNNGPVADALINDLVPQLERSFPLIAEPTARLLRGHSSGGWSTLHLATAYPRTFGATWSSAPDPVDFGFFQRVDIYNDANFFQDAKGNEHPSYTARAGEVTMTIREENLMEEVLGPDNSSAQQWDSWLAAFGGKDPETQNPVDLYSVLTGAIDRGVAEEYSLSDLHRRLLKSRAEVGRVYLSRVRLLVGDDDNFDLDNAVRSLRETVNALSFYTLPEGRHGAIVITPDDDHSTILQSPEARDIPADMVAHLRRYNHASR
ncbi:MAG: alpha/beta hydrolase-fold protein [Planctomycetota bacterium]